MVNQRISVSWTVHITYYSAPLHRCNCCIEHSTLKTLCSQWALQRRALPYFILCWKFMQCITSYSKLRCMNGNMLIKIFSRLIYFSCSSFFCCVCFFKWRSVNQILKQQPCVSLTTHSSTREMSNELNAWNWNETSYWIRLLIELFFFSQESVSPNFLKTTLLKNVLLSGLSLQISTHCQRPILYSEWKITQQSSAILSRENTGFLETLTFYYSFIPQRCSLSWMKKCSSDVLR